MKDVIRDEILESFFPLVIQYQDDGEWVMVFGPDEIEDKRPFKVMKTRAKESPL